MAAPKAEIKIQGAKDFDGQPEHAQRWITTVMRYTTANAHIYDTDQKKVIYALSYLQNSPAESWVEDFTSAAEVISTTGQAKGYGTFEDFKKAFLADFGPANAPAAAWQSLTQLKQSSCDSLTNYISEYKLLAGRAGIDETETFRYFFLAGINPGLQRAILNDETPTTNALLIKKALAKHAAYEELKNLQNMYKRGGGSKKDHNRAKKPRYQDKRDPNAMDVDYQQITGEKRDEYRRKGLCFACGKHGHMANDRTHHPKKKVDAKKSSKGKKVRREASDDETDKEDDNDEEEEEVATSRMDF